MNRAYIRFLRYAILQIVICISSNIFAYDFEVNGIYYKKLSNNQVEVTYKSLYAPSYSGEITISETVNYKDVEYSVTSIGKYAFWNCSELTGSLTIPNSVTSIGESAFSGCSGLTGSLTIPNSVTSIGNSAFYKCSGLTGSLTIPNSVILIGNYAFYECSGLTGSLTIPNSVTSIGESAFSGCSGLTGSLTIPNSVILIGNYAFYECSGLTGSLTIPNSVTSIGNSAFNGCSGLTGLLTIPNSVTSIGESAFSGCSGLTGSLTIPNSVTSIGERAFSGCKGFNGALTISNNIKIIEDYSFRGCSGLTGSLTIPNSVISIGNYAFYKCSGLTGSLTIPNSVISIGNYAFYECSGLTGSLTIPNSVTSIGSVAFFGCENFNGVLTISNNVKKIEDNTFSGCSGLTGALFIPNSVTSIGKAAFANCIGFDGSLTIPNSVTSIGDNAFGSCNSIDSVISEIKEPFAISNSVFQRNSSKKYILQVPKGTKSDYMQFTGWTKYFTHIIEEGEVIARTYTLSIKSSGNGGVTYNGATIRGMTLTFAVNDGTTATVTFAPDAGYRVASVKLNNTDVTASVVNSQYTINNITANTTLDVTFEAIPPTTYAFTISAVGNGTVTYDGNAVRGKTSSFTVVEGTNTVVTFSADEGYRLKSVKLDNVDVTPSVVDNQYTIRNIKANTSLEVEFEAIPTYSLNITVYGNGSATYNGTSVRGKTQTFTVKEGTSSTITFAPDAGYRIASVKLNNTDITTSIANNSYTISNITANTTLTVTFEEIPPTTYEINPNPTEIVVHAVERDDLVDEGGTGKPWDNEFWIVANRTLAAGEKTIVQFKYKSSIPAHTTTQCHAQPEKYLYWDAIGDIEFSEQWQNFETTFVVPAYADGMQSIDILMAHIKEACNYYVKDVVWKLADNTESLINEEGFDNFYVKEGPTIAPRVYDPNVYSPPTTYKLSIKASGNGSANCNYVAIRSQTKTFIVNEGTSATVTFSPDAGNRIASVKVNGTDVTSSVINNEYTISNITANTTLAVTFEAIPPTSYTLIITSSGNGYVAYDGNTIRSKTSSFSVVEGTNAILKFSADEGNRLKSVKLNGQDVTSAVVGNQYTIYTITANTSVEVVFEAIPTYSLNIVVSGNGSASYNGVTIRNQSQSFTLREEASVVVSFSADNGYRIASVKVNNADVTSQIVDGKITISSITQNTNVEVVFEEIPPTVYALSITATGNGSVTYDGNTIKGKTSSFTIIEGSYVTVQLSADDGYRLKSVTLNGQDVTKDVVNNQYTTDKITTDVTLIVEFESIPNITDAGIAYTVTSYDEQTVVVAAGNYGNVLTVPASFTAKEKTWTVVGIDEDALKDNTALAAIIWNPEVAFTATVSNPNLLLYVKDAQYAPATVQNVVVGDDDEGEVLMAENIVLVEAASGNDFYCPQAFTAKRISYEHNYSMISGYKTCQGWETIVLPFDVTMMINAKGQELTPYSNWQYGNSQRPFWLYEMTAQGWKAGSAIKANTPYIISMPNNEMYDVSFNQTGNIQFIGTNVEVKASTEMKTGQHGNKRLVANYQTQEASADIYALNVSNEWSQNTATEAEGSTFIRSLRSVHPFEAYLTVEGSNAPWAIPIFENLPTGINEKLIVNSEKFATATDWYTIDGRKLQGEPKKAGIYIYKGEKVRR